MSKLYPPQIEGTLPAFYGEQEDDKIKYSIKIPYSMNKTVSINLVTAILDNQAKRSRLVGILQELSTPVEFLKEFIQLTKNKIALDFEQSLSIKRSREDRNAIIDLALDKDFIRKLSLYTQLVDMVREAIKDIDASSINLGYCANLLSSENKRRQ